MSGQWSQIDNDWLVAYLKELTKALDDFVTLVGEPPLVLEEANQTLAFITDQLVRLKYYWRCLLVSLILQILEPSL